MMLPIFTSLLIGTNGSPCSEQQQVLLSSSSTGTCADLPSCSLDSPLHLRPLVSTSSSASGSDTAPVYEYQAASVAGGSNGLVQHTVTLKMDVLLYADKSAALSSLAASVVVPALLAQLKAMERILCKEQKVMQVCCDLGHYH